MLAEEPDAINGPSTFHPNFHPSQSESCGKHTDTAPCTTWFGAVVLAVQTVV